MENKGCEHMYIKIKELFERPMTISDDLFIINKDDLQKKW